MSDQITSMQVSKRRPEHRTSRSQAPEPKRPVGQQPGRREPPRKRQLPDPQHTPTAAVSSNSDTNAIFTWGRCTVKPSCAPMAVAIFLRAQKNRARTLQYAPVTGYRQLKSAQPCHRTTSRICLIHNKRRRFCDLLL